MSTQGQLNNANPTNIADLLKSVNIGDVLARLASDAAVEETVTVSSNVGVLSVEALSILAITVTAGGVAGAITPYSATVTPITKTCQIGVDRKTLTFLAGDAVTQAKVTYIKAPTGLKAALAALFQGL
jgi:hypothetical protein